MGKLYLFVKPITFQLSIKSDIQVSWSPCVIFLDWKTNDKWPKLNLEWASHRSIKTGRRLHTILQTYDMANTKNGYNHFTFSTLYMTTNQLWHWNAIHRRKQVLGLLCTTYISISVRLTTLSHWIIHLQGPPDEERAAIRHLHHMRCSHQLCSMIRIVVLCCAE